MLFAVFVPTLGCNPARGTMADDGSTGAGSAETGTSMATTGTTASSTSAPTTGTTRASQTESSSGSPEPPWEHVPDPSCGDGIPVPDIYCYRAVYLDLGPAFDDFHDLFSADFDGDGRDELVFLYRSEVSADALRAVRFDGNAFTPIGESVGIYKALGVEARDYDLDGVPDILALDGLNNLHIVYGGVDGLDGRAEFVRLPGGTGFAAPVVVDAAGHIDFLVGAFNGKGPSGLGSETLQMHQTPQGWVQIGEPMPIPGCFNNGPPVYGDFDEDGDEDVLIFDQGWGCEWNPGFYDPDFYRFSVYLSNLDGTVSWAGSFPAGETSVDRVWIEDFDADGHLDALMRFYKVAPVTPAGGISVSLGRGDGTFAEPTVERRPQETSYYVPQQRADFDGDGDLEFIASNTAIGSVFLDWPIPPQVTADLASGAIGGAVPQHADLNGDGIDDFIVRSPDDTDVKIVMISDP